jgi:hypothetical protein
MKIKFAAALSLSLAFTSAAFAQGSVVTITTPTQDSVVTVSKDDAGNFILLRNGKPFYINGAGGSSNLSQLAAAGGNSIRTWGIESMEEQVDGKRLIDRALELNLAVTAGIWLKHEGEGGFSWSKQADLDKQREDVRAAVHKYKDSPALLIWGMGNEMEGDGNNPAIYKELNVLAGIIKEEDKNHPVMTVIAGAATNKIKGVLENCPNIDILGINAYAGAGGAAESAKQAGWKKPFILTEFGPSGQWEVAKTKWGAPIEPSSWEKAKSYYGTVESIKDSKDIVLGSYVFLWGHKQEETSTWYGMFLDTGEKLPTVDVMTHEWTGHWPENRSPQITKFESPLDGNTVDAGASIPASVEAVIPKKDPSTYTLTYEWLVVAEQTVHGQGGSFEPVPPSFPECTAGQTGASVTVKVPTKPGAYRLFVTVRDGKGGASKDNIPFQVK